MLLVCGSPRLFFASLWTFHYISFTVSSIVLHIPRWTGHWNTYDCNNCKMREISQQSKTIWQKMITCGCTLHGPAAILGPFQALWSASGVLGPFPRRQSPFLINLAGDQNITKRDTRQNPSLSLCPRVVRVNKVASPISTHIPTNLASLTSVILYVWTCPFLSDL